MKEINILQRLMCFLEKYYQNTASDDTRSLLGNLQILKSKKLQILL